MQYFFVGLTKAKTNLLVDRLDDAYVQHINGVSGVLVNFDERDTALMLLEKSVAKELPAEDDEMIHVLLLEGQRPKLVEKIVRPVRVTTYVPDSSCSSDFFSPSDLKKITEETLLPKLGKDIEVIRYTGYVDCGGEVDDDGVFRVHVWYSATGTYEDGRDIRTRFIFGFDTTRTDWSWYAPSHRGVILSDPESGSPVAEIIGNNVYIFPPISYASTRNGLKIFRRILEEVAAELSLSPEQRAERDRQRVEVEKEKVAREHVQTRVAYIELCKQRLSKVVEEARQRVAKSEGVLEETQTSIVSTHRELAGSRKKLEQLRQIKEAEDQRFAQEFDRICAIPQVEDVLMRNGRIMQIMTSVLTCTDPSTGKIYELGKFRIEIPVNGGNIHWFNLTRQIDGLEVGMHSPVVDANGCTILINAIQAFPELIANYEIATAVQLALQVPGSIDPGEEHAKHLDKWPLVSAA